jgi:hypothetical protein
LNQIHEDNAAENTSKGAEQDLQNS